MSAEIAIAQESESSIAARQKILALQGSMQEAVNSGDLQERDCPLTHYFAPGLYVREMFIPAGTTIVGKIHRHAHFNDISKGRIRVYTEFGYDVFDAPYRFVSKAGTKRCVFAETDTIWTTYHPTNETELEKIEQDVIAPTYEELQMLSYTDIKGFIS